MTNNPEKRDAQTGLDRRVDDPASEIMRLMLNLDSLNRRMRQQIASQTAGEIQKIGIDHIERSRRGSPPKKAQ